QGQSLGRKYRALLPSERSSAVIARDSEPGTTAGTSLRALVIDDHLPTPQRDAGSNAILSHVAALQRLGYDVALVPSAGFRPPREAVQALESLGIRVYAAPYFASVEEVLRRQAGAFDLVYMHRVSNAFSYGELVATYCPSALRIYGVADLHHVRVARQA